MPELPTWFTELARQFPVLVIVLLVVWYAVKYIREQHVAHMEQLRQRFDDQMRTIRESHRQQIETLSNWIEDLKKDRDRLNRELGKREK